MALAPIAFRETSAEERIVPARIVTALDYADARDARDLDRQEARYAELCGPVTVRYVKVA
jgi:hypothetical protein